MMLLPHEALKQLQCAACSKTLSVFPIYIDRTSNVPICGRCSDLAAHSANYAQDTVYQSVAQFIRFPCIYHKEGCLEALFPDQVPGHEQSCPHRIIACTMDCIWQGSAQELLPHIENLHADFLLRNDNDIDAELELDILKSHEVNNFVVFKDEVFSFKRKINAQDNVLECSIFCFHTLDTVTTYCYEVKISNGTRSLSKKFPMTETDSVIIHIGDVQNMLDNPSVMIMSVGVLLTQDKPDVKPVRDKSLEFQSELLAELECPVCFDYIIPPIYQCITGHSICGDCKAKVEQCPTCREDIKDTQNFTLEKMAYLLTYPCRFTVHGCDFSSKPGQIKSHHKHCLFGPKECPLKEYHACKWQGKTKDIYPHIKNIHHDNVLEIDQVSVFLDNGYFDREEKECYVKKYGNSLFVLHFRYSGNRFCWAMQVVGPPEEAKRYQFELDIVDNNNRNQRLFVRSLCTTLTAQNDAFNDNDRFTSFFVEQIKGFIKDEELTYAVRVLLMN